MDRKGSGRTAELVGGVRPVTRGASTGGFGREATMRRVRPGMVEVVASSREQVARVPEIVERFLVQRICCVGRLQAS